MRAPVVFRFRFPDNSGSAAACGHIGFSDVRPTITPVEFASYQYCQTLFTFKAAFQEVRSEEDDEGGRVRYVLFVYKHRCEFYRYSFRPFRPWSVHPLDGHTIPPDSILQQQH
ncbi:hypothetical protein ACI65C_003126 [Semiaphis heraclei]